MINKPTSIQPYTAFRFFALTRSGKDITLHSAHHDPFVHGMWIARAHVEDSPTLASILSDEKELDIYLMSRGRDSARKITVEYEGVKWYPIDIDCSRDGAALEWVLLDQAKYTSCVDLKWDDIPNLIHKGLSMYGKQPGES